MTRSRPMKLTRVMTVATLAMATLVLVACRGEESAPVESAIAAGPPIERTSTQGPITATVQVAPAKARVGDVLRLTLTVDAEAGAEVTMPPFGEALGRFDVVGFSPRDEVRGAGRRHIQEYRLQASRSGRLRIPPLRVEYAVAAASGAGAKAAGAKAAGAKPTPTVEELLTEELPVEIQSVLTAEGSGTLGAVRGELDEVVGHAWLVPASIAGGVALLALAFLAVRARRRRRRAAVRRSAAEIAFGRLAALERGGLPEGREAADRWYVELSDIVRRYIEDRFGIRAPELTTEEFLREARRLSELGEPHRALLSAFLEGCDRVKFAGHEPAADESSAALALARRLIEETRVAATAPPGQSGQPGHDPAAQPQAAEVAS
jgi:hypothetical protein